MPAGPQGPAGVDGLQGPEGVAGPVGPQGASGFAPVVTVVPDDLNVLSWILVDEAANTAKLQVRTPTGVIDV